MIRTTGRSSSSRQPRSNWNITCFNRPSVTRPCASSTRVETWTAGQHPTLRPRISAARSWLNSERA
jgi:hypothetical protein